MGTSLSGLTPATTFDGLLKTSDNEPLDGTLKAISTGDGTDTMLELSTSALQIGGATGMYWDNTNKRLGFNDVTPTSRIDIKNTFGASSLSQLDRMGLFVGYTSASFGIALGGTSSYTSGLIQGTNNIGNASGTLSLNPFGGNVGVGSVSPSAQLHIKGSGASAGTTSLLVQNGEGSELFKLTDDGNINLGEAGASVYIQAAKNIGKSLKLGNQAHLSSFDTIDFKTWDGTSAYTEVMRITGNTDQLVGIGETTPTARLHIKGSGNDNTTTSLLVQNSDASASLTYDDSGKVEIVGNSQTGFIQTYGFGAVGFGNESGPTILYGNNLAGLHTGSGYTAFGANSSSSQRVLIKGSGATSATTALLVQNSAGTELFDITDNGEVEVKSGDFRIPSYKSIYGGGSSTYAITLQGTTAMNFKSWAKDFAFNTQNGTIATLKNDGKFGLGETAPSAQLQVKGSGNDATTTALLVQNSDGTDMLSVKDDLSVVFNSTITSASSTLRFDVGGVGTIRMNSDKVAIGGNTTPTARLHVKGSGATSATTALLVENSAGTELLKVVDDGQLEIKSNSGRVSTTSGTSIFSYSSGGGGVLDVNPSNNNSVKFRARGDNDTFLIQTNPAGDNVGIGASSPDSTAKLQVDSTTQGFLPPRMTDAERDAITTPAAGLMVYNTTTNKAQCYNGTAWQDLF